MDSSIKVKLLSSGKYTWEITLLFDELDTEQRLDTTRIAKQIDTQLKNEFPNHVQMGNSRVVNLEED